MSTLPSGIPSRIPSGIKILLVDDDPQSLASTRKILDYEGYDVTTATDGQSALEIVRSSSSTSSLKGGVLRFDLVVTDVRMPRLGGLEFLRALSLCGETMPVILMTAFGKVEDAVWAMKLGAVDFLTKPFRRQALLSSVEAALKRIQGRSPAESSSHGSPSQFHGNSHGNANGKENLLVGRSAALHELKELIHRVAPTQATVLLTGESGTGKELVARCIHQSSARAKNKFIALNCAAVPEQLMESELFGFEKGAFTGALGAKEGLFEVANGGTLLLDEIGDMPYALQAKLLRALQDNEVRRLGATTPRKIDVRVIAATHRDLKQDVQEGKFRLDLLYRLEVIGIHVPPLRSRLEDISDLAHYLIRSANQKYKKSIEGLSPETLEILLSHSWPGNVRELSNVLERAIIFATDQVITPADLPPHLVALFESGQGIQGATEGIKPPSKSVSSPSASTISVPLGTSLKDVEELLIRKTLEATDGDKNMTAKLLGINSRTIYRKLDKNIEK